MAEFLSEVNVKHVLVTPSILKKLTDAVFAVNTARQSATQESQFLLVYGREPNAPADNLFPWSVAKSESTRACVRRVDRLRKTVRHVLLAKQRKTNKRVDAMRQRATEYAPCDLVLVLRNLSEKGLTKKFMWKFFGPFQVLFEIAPTTYQVEDVSSSRRKSARRFHAHVCRMKRFRMRQRPGVDDEEVVTVEGDTESEKSRTCSANPRPERRQRVSSINSAAGPSC